MDYKTEMIAFAVRLVADRTNLIRKPDTFETFLTQLFGEESYDRRLAKEIEVEAARAATAFKRFNTNRKFKKIISHI